MGPCPRRTAVSGPRVTPSGLSLSSTSRVWCGFAKSSTRGFPTTKSCWRSWTRSSRPKVRRVDLCLLPYEYVLSFHFDVKFLHRNRRVHLVDSGGDVVSPGVPRTDDDLAFQLAFAQRPAAVRAGAADRVKRPFDVENRQRFAVVVNRSARARANIG